MPLIAALAVAAVAGMAAPGAAGADVAILGDWGSFGIGEPGKFSHPQSVAVGPDGHVYVSDLGNKRIQSFLRYGHYDSQWGFSGTGEGGFRHPAGVAADGGHVYVTDRDLHRVQKFTHNGTFVSEWGSRGSGAGQLLLPGDMAAHGGTIYVIDTGNQRVQAFDANGTLVRTIGSSGLGEGQFVTPAGIDVDVNGSVYVTDRGLSKIVQFHANGTLAKEFKFHYYGYVFSPTSIALDPDGAMYVFNSATGRIMHLAPDEPELVGIAEQRGPYKTTFKADADLAIGIHGELLAVDSAGHTLRVFKTPYYAEPEIVPPSHYTEEEKVIFFDTTGPKITAPPDVTVDARDYRTWVDIGKANATDASGIRTMGSTAPQSFKPGSTTVVWTASDNAGYSSTAEQEVVVTACGRQVSTYNVIRGTDGGDVLEGTDGDDLMFGMGGADLITGGGGDDCIFGGSDDDIISGGGGNDTIRGNGGHDILKGESGDDAVHAGEGYDVIDGGEGADACHAVPDVDVAINCE